MHSGANLYTTNNQGEAPLGLARNMPDRTGAVTILQIVERRQARRDHARDSPNSRATGNLFYTLEAGHGAEAVLNLLASGADVTATHEAGRTVLHWAARASTGPEIIDMLVEAGVDIEALNMRSNTPLIVAAKISPNPEILQALANAGANGEFVNERGWTALHYVALQNQQPEFIPILT